MDANVDFNQIPAVLVFSGSDSRGAGIQADIEALKALGCHGVPIISGISVPANENNKKNIYPLPATLIIEQARAVLEDIPIAACKIGLLGSSEIASSIHTLLTDYPTLPVVFNPDIQENDSEEFLETLTSLLFPLTSILSLSCREARELMPEADSVDACAQMLMELGCQHVLLTGDATPKNQLTSYLYSNRRQIKQFTWRRLPYVYYGAGCTLSAAIAGFLAQGLDVVSAAHEAQQYLMKTLEHAYRLGVGKLIPNRFYWAKGEAVKT